MYYNIKIKSNGSEFSLESYDKEVIQREMDLYFACIFDVSDDFKENIKKIEITNKNVRSINEVEIQKNAKQAQQLSEERIQELAKIRAQEIIKAQQAKIEEEAKENLFNKEEVLPIQNSIEEITLPPVQPAVQTMNEVIKFQNEPSFLIEEEEPTVTEATQSELPNEILELISLAQKKIEAIEKSPTINVLANNENNTPKTTRTDIYEKETLSSFELKNQEKLENIFNAPTPEQSFEEYSEESNVQTPQTSEENILENLSEVSLTDVELGLQPKTQEEATFQPVINTPVNIQEIKEEPTQENIQTDFKAYLSGFNSNGLVDELTICAYYIKNILNQDNFTMKFVNSKLFQATGKIADMSIIDELITKDYIEVINTEEGKKYCITANGEEYFAIKFQG